MQSHLAITILADENPRLLTELLRLTTAYNCNLIETRLASLGQAQALCLLCSGSWDGIARLETAMPATCEKLNAHLHMQRTEPASRSSGRIPYAVEVIAPDSPAIIHRIAVFFADRSITLHELGASSLPSPQTGTPMCMANFTIHVPADTYIGLLRSEFMEFCDANNFDAVLEPAKF